MRVHLTWILFLLVTCAIAQKPEKSAAELKKEMGRIMHETNWSDKAAADSANAKIAEISKQMMMIGARQQVPADAGSSAKVEEKLKENVDYQMQLWNQMWNIARKGDNTNIDLAQPLRQDIVEEYKDDEDPTIKNPDWLQAMPDLTINMSMPQVQVIIDQMPVFRGIKRLIITCEEVGTSVNLDEILTNAKDYPLTELYILNFGTAVTILPAQVGTFKELTVLNLLNNNLYQLPSTVSGLNDLRALYVDMNPVEQLLPVVSPLKSLATLGVANTKISVNEIEQIQQLLPECNILTQ